MSSSGVRRPRVLNPAFAAAHGLGNAESDGIAVPNETSNTSATTNKSLEIVLKQARDTGKLIASNCAGLKTAATVGLPNECFEFPFHLSQYTEELLTVVDFSDDQQVLGETLLDERILRYQAVQSLRFRNCGVLLPPGLSLKSLKNLTILDLSGNRIEGSLDLGQFLPASLAELNLSNNRLCVLKATNGEGPLVNLPNLRSLDVSHNPHLERLFGGDDHDNFFSCESLRIFRCHHNPNLSCPSSVNGLFPFLQSARSSLEVMEASHSPKLAVRLDSSQQQQQQQYPIDLSDFARLQTVSFAMNKLECCPCISLSVHTLDLRSNKLASLSGLFQTNTVGSPAESELVDLVLADNYLTRLDPSVVQSMVHLRRMDISSNKLMMLPYQLGFLKELSVLEVSGNPVVTKFSTRAIQNPQALLEILRKRAPEGTGESISQIAGLLSIGLKGRTALDLGGKLNDPTAGLEGLIHDLQSNDTVNQGITGALLLDSNQLESLPENLLSADCLPNVKDISLTDNRFAIIPSCLQTMPGKTVTALRLGKNRLTSQALEDACWFQPLAASSSWSLQSVTHLDLSSNKLTAFPMDVSKGSHCFPALEVLNLYSNRIESVDDWKRLPSSLRTLELSENSIDNMESLSILLAVDCPNLQHVSLRHNRLQKIPGSLGLLVASKSMTSLQLQGNPQRAIRHEVLERPCRDLLKYLLERMTDDQRMVAIRKIQSRRNEREQQANREEEEVSSETITTSSRQQPPSDPTGSPVETDTTPEKDTTMLQELQRSVEELQVQLENLSLTQAQKYALKKSLAMERSKMIREERRLGLRK